MYCNLAEEDTKQLFVNCAVVRIIWALVLAWGAFPPISPAANMNLRNWWKQARNLLQKKDQKRNSLVILIVWNIYG
jgi:hypothetical protein